ncbi:uncharacterized protein AKAME5_002209200 [Lates japonicus]|uniref:Uncharacterized protein n=1 Tax=Lates japonicus TaxID=270547 RepID=A0AAD3NGN0_LATJO|nr:uncharacterized protein AKAME5_002209200 [Lates japonicus]
MYGPKDEGFFITLPSNASLNVFKDNKSSSYRVDLAQHIDLEGRWEVALTQISYPHTFYTIMQDDAYFFGGKSLKNRKQRARYIVKVSPLVKKGFAIAKPHLKAAASNIASDVFSHAMRRVSSDPKQEGSGGIMVLSRRTRKRPPGERAPSSSNKRSGGKKRKSVAKSRRVKKKSARSSDIF